MADGENLGQCLGNEALCIAGSKSRQMVGEFRIGAERGLDRENDIAGEVGKSRNCSMPSVYMVPGYFAERLDRGLFHVPASAGLATEPMFSVMDCWRPSQTKL